MDKEKLIEELEDDLFELTKKYEDLRRKKAEEAKTDHYYKNVLYGLLASRHKGLIEEKEKKTISQLKELVQPANPFVLEIAEKINASIRTKPGAEASARTEPEAEGTSKAGADACLKACDFAKTIKSIPSLGVAFWMTIPEMLEHKVADYEDKAILLCSLMRALGSDAKVVVVELTDASNRPLVIADFGERFLVCDPNSGKHFLFRGTRPTAISEYKHETNVVKNVLFEFNDREYEDYREHA